MDSKSTLTRRELLALSAGLTAGLEDYQLPARLAAAVEIPITGGEGYRGLGPFRQCVVNQTYDILQPDNPGAGVPWDRA